MNPEIPVFYMRVEIEILAGQESWERFVSRLTEQREQLIPERCY